MEQAIENGELLKPQKIQKYEWSKADDCFLLFFSELSKWGSRIMQ